MPDDQTDDNWYDPNATTFGDRLTGAREAAGLNQAELARRLGTKVKTVRAWENDQSEPRANRLSMLCGLLNVSLVWLLTGAAVGQTPAPAQEEDGTILKELEVLRREASALSDRLGLLEARLRARLSQS